MLMLYIPTHNFCFFLQCMCGYNTLGGACDYFCFYASFFICFPGQKREDLESWVWFSMESKKGIQKGKDKRC